MATLRRQEEDLQDSWVELNTNGKNGDPVDPQSAYNGQMERLLIEAQKESREASRNVSRTPSPKVSPAGSPKNLDSPNNQSETQEERDPGTDWVWDWSSRPEVNPPSGYGRVFKRPSQNRPFSVRKSRFFCSENLPTFLLGIGVGVGATVLVICVKNRWVRASIVTAE